MKAGSFIVFAYENVLIFSKFSKVHYFTKPAPLTHLKLCAWFKKPNLSNFIESIFLYKD